MDGIGDAAADGPVPPWAARRRFDVADYYRMAEAGVLGEDDPVELIDGEIIEMSPIGAPHIGTIMALHRWLFLAAGDRFAVSVQNPLRLDDRNEPEPDLVLLRPRADRYYDRLPPTAADALLVIEVADSSLRYDTQVKVPLYARHGIPELWIVDVAAGAIEVFRAPAGGAYADVAHAARGEVVAPLAIPGACLSVNDVVPG